jgi:Flp pilus assembly protein TadG
MRQSNGVRQSNGLNIWRASENRRGQVMVFMALTMPLIFGMTAIVFDFGMVYINQNRLSGSTQAAALAGAEAMAQAGATTASVTAAATLYSGASGDDNANSGLTGVSMVSGYPTLSCLSTLQSSFGINCYGPSSTNAIRVKQQVSAPLYFLGLFGFNSVNLTSTATASMKGANVSPFNVAIIVDTTGSMSSTDSDSTCSNSRINCALAGVQVLLKNLSPCLVSESSCGAITNGNVSNSVDRVSLMAFPAVTALTSIDDTNCGSTRPTTVAYATPFLPTSTYQIVNFSSDYRASDTSSTLNTGSNLVAAVAGPHGTPCMQVVGGYGTYYAQAIKSAQAYLVAEQALYPNSKNAMILLSDGDATATCSSSLLGICLTGAMPGASTTSGTYMSTLQECHQAVTAAQAAATAGTRVYSVAYGATSSGCGTDTSPTITPCETMREIASSPGYFFSDYTATGGSSSCVSAAQPVTSLSQIFQVIAGDFTVARLIPNSTN